MNLVGKLLTVSCFSLALLIGCSSDPSSNLEVSGEGGSINIQLIADAASDFKDVAKSAEVKISGEGMLTLTKPLTVTATGISGTITGIPAGTERKFEVFVYDASNKVCYYGGAFGNVSAGGTASIALTLYKSTGEGNATISGSIESGNTPPVVSLTSPVNNAQYSIGEVISLAASASDADGSVSNVSFYNGGTLIGTDASTPFTCNLTSTAAGTLSLTAVATDNSGASTRSSVISVTVRAVSSVTYQINAGGPAVSPYAADGYFSGGTASSTTSTVTTTGVVNPAPAAVYKTERYGNVTYTMPNLAAGTSYKVRLHFAELYWTASGKRSFNVSINGSQVISNFDIYVAAGGAKKAIIKEFTATANTRGQILIAFSKVTDNAQICGIEILPNQIQTFTVTYISNGGSGTVPTDNTTYTNGSTATVKANPGALVNGDSSFVGWLTTGGITYACGQQITITGDLQLTARYSATDVMDNDGNVYTSMVIGGKRWLLQNLKTTKYRDGSAIPFVTSGAAWRTNAIVIGGPVCAWADFNSSNTNFGLLYNWVAVQNREIGPAGWRTPTEAELIALYNAVSSTCDLISGWTGNCSGGQNSSGFSILQSGNIYQSSADDPQAYWSNSGARLWGATDVTRSSPAYARLSGVPGGVSFSIYYDAGFDPFNAEGYSIRCVKE